MNDQTRKNDEGKIRYSLILADMANEIEELCQLATIGAKTYGDRSWMGATEPIAYLNAAYRHLAEHNKGKVIDGQDGIRHTIKAAWNLLAYSHLTGAQK